MQRLFIDTNVMFDFLDKREPFYEPIAKLITLAEEQIVAIVVSPISFTTISFLLGKYDNQEVTIRKLRKFKVISEICAVNEVIIEKALVSSFLDFEDAVQYYSALEAHCNIIITRNGKDFKKALLPVMTASEYLKSRKDEY